MAVDLMGEHWNDRCSPPWDVGELKTKVDNAYAYGARAPGAYSPEVDFAGVVHTAAPVEARQRPIVAAPRRWFRPGRPLALLRDPADDRRVPAGRAPQAGKSFIALDLAHSLATGRNWFGVEPDDRGGTIFLFAGTEGSGFEQRLAALQEDTTLPISSTAVSNLRERDALPTSSATSGPRRRGCSTPSACPAA
jgi:hypothetical protein